MEGEESSNIYQKEISNTVWLAEEQMRMASERTYLAWIRTGLTSIGLGVAAAKFLIFENLWNRAAGKAAGISLIIWGMAIFLFALFNYQKSYHKLQIFKASRYALFPMIIITVALLLMVFVLFAVILE